MTKNTKRFEFVLGRTGLVSFVLGMGVLVFFFFLLGIKVGAYLDTYPEKLAALPASWVRYLGLLPEQKLAVRQEEDSLRQAKESREGKITTAAEETDRLKADIIEKQVAEEEGRPEAKGAQVQTTTTETPTPRSLLPPTESQQEIATTAPATNQVAAEKSVPDNNGKYFIQLASFRERDKAEQFCEQVRLLGFKPEVESREQSESERWFRVVLRNIQTEEEAHKIIALLHKKYKGIKCVLRKREAGNN